MDMAYARPESASPTNAIASVDSLPATDLVGLKEIFQAMETDDRGTILQTCLQVFASSLPANDLVGLKEMFQAMDTDNSGTISVEELHEGLKKKGTQMNHQCAIGLKVWRLAAAEATSILAQWLVPPGIKFVQLSCPFPREAQYIMDNIDVNGNSRIDYEEFLAATLAYNKLNREDNMMEAFKFFDVAGSGFITKQEILVRARVGPAQELVSAS
eukprot:1147374-Pelagomonas_calceolata.AAC.10